MNNPIPTADKLKLCQLCKRETIPSKLLCCKWCYVRLMALIDRGELKLNLEQEQNDN
jgi:hypothetical protein